MIEEGGDDARRGRRRGRRRPREVRAQIARDGVALPRGHLARERGDRERHLRQDRPRRRRRRRIRAAAPRRSSADPPHASVVRRAQRGASPRHRQQPRVAHVAQRALVQRDVALLRLLRLEDAPAQEDVERARAEERLERVEAARRRRVVAQERERDGPRFVAAKKSLEPGVRSRARRSVARDVQRVQRRAEAVAVDPRGRGRRRLHVDARAPPRRVALGGMAGGGAPVGTESV
eukprot:29982-Pelagococcus_subviridis.AAC.7